MLLARALVARSRALSRAFCSSVDEASKAAVLEFLRTASRPIMGKAKAKQSAGQKAIDLTKQANRLEDLDLQGLIRVDGAELRRRGLPCQERKRLLNFIDKYRQGFRHDGRQGKHAWRGWLQPYRQSGHAWSSSALSSRPRYQD
jgi:hypothetical protein